jgi:hypothetical protein
LSTHSTQSPPVSLAFNNTRKQKKTQNHPPTTYPHATTAHSSSARERAATAPPPDSATTNTPATTRQRFQHQHRHQQQHRSFPTWSVCGALLRSCARSHAPVPSMTAAACTVSGLWVYPVKGCRGIQVPAAAVMPTGEDAGRGWRHSTRVSLAQRVCVCATHRAATRGGQLRQHRHRNDRGTPRDQRTTGLQYDRCWMVVRSDTGKFVTQRQIPKLCQVRCVGVVRVSW